MILSSCRKSSKSKIWTTFFSECPHLTGKGILQPIEVVILLMEPVTLTATFDFDIQFVVERKHMSWSSNKNKKLRAATHFADFYISKCFLGPSFRKLTFLSTLF